MTLDVVQKVSDILFKGIIATAIAVATLYFTWQKNSGDMIRQCDSFFLGLMDTAPQKKATDEAKQSMAFRIENYGRMCGRLTDTQVGNIMNLMPPADVTAPQPAAAAGTALKGWTALSRKPVDEYADVNFDSVSGSGKFSVGDVVKARWSVNLRKANTPVSRGDNPVTGIVQPGTCVRIDTRASGQLNEWAEVTQVDCR